MLTFQVAVKSGNHLNTFVDYMSYAFIKCFVLTIERINCIRDDERMTLSVINAIDHSMINLVWEITYQ